MKFCVLMKVGRIFSGVCCHQCILCEVMYIVFSTNFVWYVTFVGRAYGEYG